MPAFQATGSSKPREDSLPQPPYIVLDAAPIHGVPIEDLALRSVHLTVSNLPIGSGISNQLLLTGSPDPRQLPFGPGNRPYPTSYAATIRRRGRYTGSRFPVAFRPSAFASWVLLRPLGRFSLPRGRPTGGRPAGPQRGCHVAHEQDSTGQGAPFTPGTVVRSRPTTILRPAPAASQRPVPTAPLTHPIGGGHLHEASSGVHSRSPITPRGWRPPRSRKAKPLPAGLLLAHDHRMERRPHRRSVHRLGRAGKIDKSDARAQRHQSTVPVAALRHHADLQAHRHHRGTSGSTTTNPISLRPGPAPSSKSNQRPIFAHHSAPRRRRQAADLRLMTPSKFFDPRGRTPTAVSQGFVFSRSKNPTNCSVTVARRTLMASGSGLMVGLRCNTGAFSPVSPHNPGA